MISVPTALLGIAIAVAVNLLLNLWTRYRDRCGVAAALAGELGAYFKNLQPQKTAANFKALADVTDTEMRRRRLRMIPKAPEGHPVFDKVADKIGLLPVREATDVSAVYNMVTVFRLQISHLSEDNFINGDDQVQSETLRILSSMISDNYRDSEDLIARLAVISKQRFSSYLCRN